MNNNGGQEINLIEYLAALWALIFGFLHIAWAFGWYLGLDAAAAQTAFERSWFLAFDLIAAFLCFVAAGLVIIRLRSSFPPSASRFLIWSCAVILTLRGAAGAVNAVRASIIGGSIAPLFSFWDWWFCVGAFLFAASARRFSSHVV